MAITVSDEPWDKLEASLSGAMQCLGPWVGEYGPTLLDRLVMVLIADGVGTLHPSTKQSLQQLGLCHCCGAPSQFPSASADSVYVVL